MSRRHLVPLAAAVVALLALVAFAAHGRPLSSGGGKGGGLPTSFWDYVFTTAVVVEVLLLILGVAALIVFRREQREVASYNRRTLRAIATLLLVVLLVTFIARHLDLNRLHPLRPHTTPAAPGGGGHNAKHHRPVPPQHVRFRWEEVAVVLGLLALLGAAAVATRRRLGPATGPPPFSPKLLAASLDESLDDLRSDPDLRRAIVAAYARMETALAAAGLPRRPAEAPLEYLERALLSLDASAEAVRRLTDLFEWARFSHHEPEPSMRDDAVDALVAVRDELRASEPLPA